MKANKITLTVTVEVLSVDTLPSMLFEASEFIQKENTSGTLTKSDGDRVTWEIKSKEVDF